MAISEEEFIKLCQPLVNLKTRVPAGHALLVDLCGEPILESVPVEYETDRSLKA
jgi:hypothetical protein